MSIHIDEKCFICSRNLVINEKVMRLQQVLHRCPNCGIYICNSCFENKINSEENLCPNCKNNLNQKFVYSNQNN